MTSSTTGERRWGTAKKGGMTVLGKVAVPKPINLPSQRLENHGLDPNVEIVPKGSLSWGTRSSSSGSNAWGSSSVLSPRTEGGSASSSHLSGRPSSSGGTRPSTAGSERNPDIASNSWTANSRPSSASGILASNNTSLAVLRPHSAETRPGSSQLSRFAEPMSEVTATPGASAAVDKLGIAALSRDGFSLSSGDFPTLGSEKASGKNMESLDDNSHGHSGTSGPSATTEKMEAAPADDISQPTDAKNSMVNSWENDVPRPGMERWHGDSYSYPNHNISPHPPYETWRGGPPLNPQGGVWFRGPPGAPYGTPPVAAPGGFPMERFPYYCPQVPTPGHANSQTVHPHGAGPSGPHSKNGDSCRPFMEPYISPGMPIRPGFYPGYYGQPMGFCNPNERDFTLMGRPSGPPIFNKYPNQNAMEPTVSNARSFGGRTLEQVESGPPLDSRSSVPVKQIKGWDKNNKEPHFGNKASANAHPHDKGHAANASSQDNLWSDDPRKEKEMNHGKKSFHGEQASSVPTEDKTGVIDPIYVKHHGNNNSAESADVNHVVADVALPRDPTLIKKIEGLNAKARATDGRHDFRREEPYGRGQMVNSNVSYSTNEASANVHRERHYPSGMLVPVSDDKTILAEDKGFGSTVGSVVTNISRHASHNVQGRGDHNSKGRLNSQEADGWRKRSATSESRGIVSVVNSERKTIIQRKEQPPTMKYTEISNADGEVKGDLKLPMLDPCDSQHVRPKDPTKQRAIQLQREEEERTRERKAKAFAKLEELNRRSANQKKETSRQEMDDVPSHADGANQKKETSRQEMDDVPSHADGANQKKETSRQELDDEPSHADGLEKQQQSKVKIELQFGSFQSGEIGATVAFGLNSSKTSHGSESISSGVICSQTDQSLKQKDPVLPQKQSLPAIDDVHVNDVADRQNVLVRETSRQKGSGYKQKHSIHSGKNLTAKPIVDVKDKSSSSIGVLKDVGGKGVSSSFESNLPVDLPAVSSSLLHPKGKHYRAGKNKHTVDESFSVSSASVRKEFGVSRAVAESMKQDAIEHKSYSNDAVVWAPVKSHTKNEPVVENVQKSDEDTALPNRNGNAVPSSSKSRRAEIERYVPKAANKGLTQQGSDLLSASPSAEKSIPDGSSIQGQVSSQTIERTKGPVDYRHVENKTKKTQAHGSWHERNSTEANLVQNLGDSSSSVVGPAKNSQSSDGAYQTQKPKELLKGSVVTPIAQLVEVQPSKQDEQRGKQQLQMQEVNEDTVVDGWVMYDEPVSSGPAILSGVEGHGKSTRGKKNPFKGNRGSRNHQNIDHESHIGAKGEVEYFSDAGQAEMPRPSKEHRVAQWQPKPQTHGTNQHGNYARGRQSVAGEGDKTFKREGSKDASSQLKQQNQDTAENMVQPQIHSVVGSKDASRMPNMGGRESKAAPKDTANPPKESTLGDVESAPLGHTDGINNEQRSSSSGNRWNGNPYGRFNRAREFRGDRSFISHDNRQNYVPANREKQRQNSQYEYQPVGPYNRNQRGDNSEGQSENRHTGAKFSSRGQGSHSQRGRGGPSSYGWQRVTNPTDAGSE